MGHESYALSEVAKVIKKRLCDPITRCKCRLSVGSQIFKNDCEK